MGDQGAHRKLRPPQAEDAHRNRSRRWADRTDDGNKCKSRRADELARRGGAHGRLLRRTERSIPWLACHGSGVDPGRHNAASTIHASLAQAVNLVRQKSQHHPQLMESCNPLDLDQKEQSREKAGGADSPGAGGRARRGGWRMRWPRRRVRT